LGEGKGEGIINLIISTPHLTSPNLGRGILKTTISVHLGIMPYEMKMGFFRFARNLVLPIFSKRIDLIDFPFIALFVEE